MLVAKYCTTCTVVTKVLVAVVAISNPLLITILPNETNTIRLASHPTAYVPSCLPWSFLCKCLCEPKNTFIGKWDANGPACIGQYSILFLAWKHDIAIINGWLHETSTCHHEPGTTIWKFNCAWIKSQKCIIFQHFGAL